MRNSSYKTSLSSIFFRTEMFLGMLFVGCAFAGAFCSSTRVTVTRESSSVDVFKQDSNCTLNSCSAKGAYVQQGLLNACVCRCKSNSSSFVPQRHFAGSYCVDNVALRSRYANCDFLLSSNKPYSPLSVIDVTKPGSLNVVTSHKPAVVSGRGQYLDKGTWIHGSVSNTTVFSFSNNVFKWSGIAASQYAGRIVRVQFTYSSDDDHKGHCVVFKVSGSLSYDLSDSLPTISPSPSLLPASPSTSSPTPTLVVTSIVSKATIVPVEPTTIAPTLATVSIATSSVMVIDIGGTSTTQLDTCSRGAGVFCQWLYFGLAMFGCVLLLIIVAVAVFGFRRKRRRVSNSIQKGVVFFEFDAELSNKKSDYDTELLTLVENTKSSNGSSENRSEDELNCNEPSESRNNHRPLKFVEVQVRPIIPPLVQRISTISSNDGDFTDDDSKQLIRHHSSSNSNRPTATNRSRTNHEQITNRSIPSLTKEAVLNHEEDEETYEIMDYKSFPRGPNKEGHKTGASGIDNQAFEEEKRQSIYEIMEEHPNYETMEKGLSDEQPNYETMETCLSDEQPNYETMESGFSDEQTNYESMETGGLSEEHSNYEVVDVHVRPAPKQQISSRADNYPDLDYDLNYDVMEPYLDDDDQPNYEVMGGHNNNGTYQHHADKEPAHQKNLLHNEPSGYSRKDQDEGHEDKLYDIPVINDDSEDTHYEIPPISEDTNPEYHYVHTSSQDRLAVPGNHDDQDDDVEYTYVSVPEAQAREMKEHLQDRKSWHSGEQPPKTRAKNLSGSKTFAEPGFVKRQPKVSPEGNPAVQDDDDELYSVAEHPKPPPALLRKGRCSPAQQCRQVNDSDSKVTGKTNAVGPKIPGKVPPTRGSESLKNQADRPLRSKEPTPRRIANVEQPTTPQHLPNIPSRKRQQSRNEESLSPMQNEPFAQDTTQAAYVNLAELYNDVRANNRDPVPHELPTAEDNSVEAGDEEEVFYDNMGDTTLDDIHDEQALYENVGYMMNQQR